jgi:hypothetical protein
MAFLVVVAVFGYWINQVAEKRLIALGYGQFATGLALFLSGGLMVAALALYLTVFGGFGR